MKDKKVHIGHNVKFARENLAKISQEELAIKINSSSSTISRLESQEEVNDEILKNIALALDIPFDFFKTFTPDNLMAYVLNQSTNTFSDGSHDTVNQGNEQIVYNYPVEQVMILAKDILQMQKEHYIEEQKLIEKYHQREVEQQDVIRELKTENAILKAKLVDYERKNNS